MATTTTPQDPSTVGPSSSATSSSSIPIATPRPAAVARTASSTSNASSSAATTSSSSATGGSGGGVSSSSIASSSSRLIPPNPSLSPSRPSGSILLNRDDPSCVKKPPSRGGSGSSNGGGAAGAVLSSVKSAFSWTDAAGQPMRGRQQGPPASAFNGRLRAGSMTAAAAAANGSDASAASGRPPGMPGLARSQSATASRGVGGGGQYGLPGRSPSAVTFAPLPDIPDLGLGRRRSITLGVAARSDMLRTQGAPRANMNGNPGVVGGVSPGAGGAGSVVMMTDAEWAEYQARVRRQASPPELHTLIGAGTKKLWKKARSLSGSSSSAGSDKGDEAAAATTAGKGKQQQPASTSTSQLPPSPQKTLAVPASPSFRRPIGLGDRPIPESAVAESIPEEDEEYQNGIDEEDDEEDGASSGSGSLGVGASGLLLDSGGDSDDEQGRARSRSFASTSDASTASEEEEMAPLPEFLKRDLAAERSHYAHHVPESGSSSGRATPRHAHMLDAPDYAHLHRKLSDLHMSSSQPGDVNVKSTASAGGHANGPSLGEVVGRQAGDETPKARSSPRESLQMTSSSSGSRVRE